MSQIIDQLENRDFDCILGLSGGVDSCYMLHLAVKELGLRPLVFHVDSGWNSEQAVKNIQLMIDKLGLDLYTEVINWEEMKDLQLSFFKSGVPHIDIPQDMAYMATLFNFADKNNIKYNMKPYIYMAFLALIICITTGSGELASRLFYFCLALDLYLVMYTACKNKISYSIISGMTGILAINSINIWVL